MIGRWVGDDGVGTRHAVSNSDTEGQGTIGDEQLAIGDQKAPGNPRSKTQTGSRNQSKIQNPQNLKSEEMSNNEYRMMNDEVQKSKLDIQYSEFKDLQKGSFLGPDFSNDEISNF